VCSLLAKKVGKPVSESHVREIAIIMASLLSAGRLPVSGHRIGISDVDEFVPIMGIAIVSDS
jgi:hypothetical protein